MRKRTDFLARRAAVDSRFDPILAAPGNTREEKRDILEQKNRELQKIADEEDRAIDLELIAQAARFDIDAPAKLEAGMWEEREKGSFLALKGRLFLRKAIDEERTRRRDVAAWWWKTILIPALAAGTGLIGALTGLVSILRHK